MSDKTPKVNGTAEKANGQMNGTNDAGKDALLSPRSTTTDGEMDDVNLAEGECG